MCWSATADLVAGAAITSVGAACLIRTHRAADLPLAALPLLLGTHQLIEAKVWHTGGGTGAATMAWAVIALPLLAVWVPHGVWCAAARPARRRVAAFVAVGALTAAFLAHGLATRPVRAEIRGHTMAYVIGLPRAELLVMRLPDRHGRRAAALRRPPPHRARRPGRGGCRGVLAAVAAGVRVDLVRAGGGLLGGPVRVGARAPRPEAGSPGDHPPSVGPGRPELSRTTSSGAETGCGVIGADSSSAPCSRANAARPRPVKSRRTVVRDGVR